MSQLVARIRVSPPPLFSVESKWVNKYGWYIFARVQNEYVVLAKRPRSKDKKAVDLDVLDELRRKWIEGRLEKVIDWWSDMDAGDDKIILHHCNTFINSLRDPLEIEYAKQYVFNSV